MRFTNADYERIGRAVVERLLTSMSAHHPPLTLDSGDAADFVGRDAQGNIALNVRVDRYCLACGIPAKMEIRGGALHITSESDAIHLADSLGGSRI